MLCIVHRELDGWHGTIWSPHDEERDAPSDDWIVGTMKYAAGFQTLRGGGVFIAAVPEEALR